MMKALDNLGLHPAKPVFCEKYILRQSLDCRATLQAANLRPALFALGGFRIDHIPGMG